MSVKNITEEVAFDCDILNRKPKEIILLAIKEYKDKNPGKALNRYDLCAIISQRLEDRYCPQEEIDEDNETNNEDEDNKKKYNGEHILKRMKLDTTAKILEKIDFYIYRHY